MKYYDEVMKLVKNGKPISNEVSKALNRVPHYIDTYSYNSKYVSALITFIERNMYLQKGGNGKIKLQPEQKFWIEMLGFEHDDGRPVITDLPIIIGAGSGKSTFLATLALAVMIVGSRRGQDVLVFANSKKQAQELFRTSQEIVTDERSPLYKLYKLDYLVPIINTIRYPITNSSISIKAMDNRTSDGVNVRMAIFDEFHAYVANVIENVRKSTAPKRKETGYTIVYSSTNGQTRDAVFDMYMNKWEKILNKEVDDDSVFPIIYKMDSIEEVTHPELYEKALPFIKTLSSPNIISDMVRKSKGNPVAQAELLAKSFNIPQKQYNALFTTAVIKNSLSKYKEIPEGARVYVGYDLSAVNDLSALVFVYKDDSDNFYVDGHAFIPRITFDKSTREQHDRYEKYASYGDLTLVDTPTVEGSQVFEYMQDYLASKGLILENVLGDSFYNRDFKKLVKDNYDEDMLIPVRQNVRTLSEPLKYIQANIESGNFMLQNELLAWNFNNLRVKIDANNNIYPNKDKALDKIDLVSATIAAVYGMLDRDDDTFVQYWNK